MPDNISLCPIKPPLSRRIPKHFTLFIHRNHFTRHRAEERNNNRLFASSRRVPETSAWCVSVESCRKEGLLGQGAAAQTGRGEARQGKPCSLRPAGTLTHSVLPSLLMGTVLCFVFKSRALSAPENLPVAFSHVSEQNGLCRISSPPDPCLLITLAFSARLSEAKPPGPRCFHGTRSEPPLPAATPVLGPTAHSL